MKSVFDGYADTRGTWGGDVCFAGANTGTGFRSSYGEVASEEDVERLYIVKGSAGCGKSTLISQVASAAERDGHRVRYYLCGSDPSSLDCAVIDGRIAILDGTPPHSVDMVYPGAKSELVNLSQFLDKSKLEGERERIVQHTTGKRISYTAAYRYLAAAEKVEDGVISLSRSLFDADKATAFAERFVRKLVTKRGGEGVVSHRYSHAITMRGLFRAQRKLDGWQTYVVRDSMRCAPLLLRLIADTFVCAGSDVTLQHMPISDHVAGIELPHLRIAIVTHATEDAMGVINTARFVRESAKATVRGELRLGASVETSCIEVAAECLESAAEHHFALEEIYSRAMDFTSADEVADVLCRDILRRLS